VTVLQNIHQTKWHVRLFGALDDVRFILAVVKLCPRAQLLIFLAIGESLQLCQITGELMVIQCAFDLK